MKDHEIAPAFEGPDKSTKAKRTRPRLSHAEVAGATLPELLAEVVDIDITAARRLLVDAGGVPSLLGASHSELVNLGLTERRAVQLRSAIALIRLAIGERPVRGQRLTSASDVHTHMRARLLGASVEEFWGIALDVRHRVLFDEMLARGSLTGVEVHPRDVFRPLIRAGAAAVLFCHNHPSGDPSPSRQDIELTSRLREVGDMCGISVLDHVIVGWEGYASLAERNWR